MRRAVGATTVAAVVATVTVNETVPDAPGVADEGFTVQVASEGAPVQVKLIAWFSPPSPPRLSE